MPQFRTLLKNRDFVLYSTGQAFSQFGDRLVQIVLIGLVYKRWPGSTFMLAKLFFFTVLPSFFISPVAGVFVDRADKRHILVISDMLRGLAILAVPLIILQNDSIIPLYAVIFFIFAAACFFLPARLAVIPVLVSRENLLLANSASSITWVVAGIAGFSLGGVLAEWAGIKNSLFMNSAVYFLSAVSFLFLFFSMKSRYTREVSADGPRAVKKISLKSFLSDLKTGLRTLMADRRIRFVAYIFFILASMVGAFYVVVIVFIQETLNSMTKDVGLLGMFLFTGVLLGSYIYGKTGGRLKRTTVIFAALVFAGIFVNIFAVGLKFMKSFWFGTASALLLGFTVSPIYVTANTIIHESTDSEVRGRIFSFIGIIMNLGFIIFMFLSSVLAEHVDRFWILIACGTGFTLLGIINIAAGMIKKATSS